MEDKQLQQLIDIVMSNDQLMKVFDAISMIGLENYYVGAGAVAQSIWNTLSGYPITQGISDVDIVYYNSDQLEESYEESLKSQLENLLSAFPLKLDVKNEARVHLWYAQKFGYSIAPYESLERAIDTWPTTATALGLRREPDMSWTVYAPYGVEDLFNMHLVANPRQITEAIYMSKVEKWTKKWPKLTYSKWREGADVHQKNKLPHRQLFGTR